MNFDFITDNMAVGTTPETQDDVKALVEKGVTHILNCRDDHDDGPLIRTSPWMMNYCWNGTSDWTPKAAIGLEPKPVEWFKKSLDFWKVWNIPDKRVYIHCSAGVNRSATTAWMFLRALQINGGDCSYIVDTNRLVASFGLIADHPWRVDAEKALTALGYIRARTE